MQVKSKKLQGILYALGPGLLMAGAAIGGSHLVQSTRAGASYGFALVWAVVLANLFKYPFFEYGPRYTAATGENLLRGYQRLGTWAITIFFIFTISTMFIILAALATVTAGLSAQMLGLGLSPFTWSLIILLICMAILLLGEYPLLDRVMKVIIVVLALSTVVAVITVLFHGRHATHIPITAPGVWTVAGISFVVALMGWMPSVIDISVWHSLWTIERGKQTGHTATLKEVRFDFNLGYIGTAVLALFFLTLGALVMFGSGENFSNSTVKFAGQLVSLYTRSLGSWAGPIIVTAAFTTMFSTTLVVTDAYPRVISNISHLMFPHFTKRWKKERIYLYTMILLVLVALVIISFLHSQIKTLIDLATTLSFLTTPVLAIINYRVIMSPAVPGEARPGLAMRILSWAGIAFWGGFALFFIYMRIGF